MWESARGAIHHGVPHRGARERGTTGVKVCPEMSYACVCVLLCVCVFVTLIRRSCSTLLRTLPRFIHCRCYLAVGGEGGAGL